MIPRVVEGNLVPKGSKLKDLFARLIIFVLSAGARAISPFLLIRLAPIKCRSFGNFLLEPELRLLESIVDSRRSERRKTLDIFFCGGGAQGKENSYLKERWGKSIRLTDSRLVFQLWANWVRNDSMRPNVNRSSCRCRDSQNLLDKYETQFVVQEMDRRQVLTILEALGVPRNRPIALLHVRNHTYDEAFGFSRDTFDSYRNSSPENFQLAVDELNARGYSVVAIGNQTSWSQALFGVVDYSGSPLRTDLSDVVLGSVASLYLGSEAAPSNLAKLFRKPALIANNTRIGELMTSSSLQIHLMKEHRIAGKLLTHSEIWRSGLGEFQHDSDLPLSAELIENSAHEILEGLRDLLSVMGDIARYQIERTKPQQERFWQIYSDGVSRYPMLPESHGQFRALIAPSFLARRPEWLT